MVATAFIRQLLNIISEIICTEFMLSIHHLYCMNLRHQGNQSDIDDKTDQNYEPYNDSDNCHGLEDV